MVYVYEQAGVLLHVEYSEQEEVVDFHTVRVMDAEYRPVGPNLVELFHNLLVTDIDLPLELNNVENVQASTILSRIVDDLDAVRI